MKIVVLAFLKFLNGSWKKNDKKKLFLSSFMTPQVSVALACRSKTSRVATVSM